MESTEAAAVEPTAMESAEAAVTLPLDRCRS
jgi:hypothetical protein